MDGGLVGLTFVGLDRHFPAFLMQLIRLSMGLRLRLSRSFLVGLWIHHSLCFCLFSSLMRRSLFKGP